MSEVPLYLSHTHSTAAACPGGRAACRAYPPATWLGFRKNNYITEMRSGSEEGSYLRLIDFCNSRLGSNKEEGGDLELGRGLNLGL